MAADFTDFGIRLYRSVGGGQSYTKPNGQAGTAGVLGSAYASPATGDELVPIGRTAGLIIEVFAVVVGASSISFKVERRYAGAGGDADFASKDSPILLYSALQLAQANVITYTGAGTYRDTLLTVNHVLADLVIVYAETTGGTPSTDRIKIAMKAA